MLHTLNFFFSSVTCITLKPHMFGRSLMHFPIGSFGSFLLFKSNIHGVVFIFLISLYQCMEMYAHFQLYNEDYSWIDLEGYLIGYSYTTCTLLYIDSLTENI